MAEPTLKEIFGDSASQTVETVTISKADLAVVGLTAASNNTGEAILAAVIAKAQLVLTLERQELHPEQSIAFSEDSQNLVIRNDQRYRQFTKVINFEKVDDETDFDPDWF
ncbi:MAG: hypothetical protein AAF915_26115 [Cyanobacteria bacterium P01_D01_bin.50]